MTERTAYAVAERYVGVKELAARGADHPLIQWSLMTCGYAPTVEDEVPWCSAFVNHVCHALGIPRSHSAAARSWLRVGRPITLDEAQVGEDVVVLARGAYRPGPEVISAPGHVGFFAGRAGKKVCLLGGNQGDAVSLAWFPEADVLGARRLG